VGSKIYGYGDFFYDYVFQTKIGDKTYFISSIPAVNAQKMLIRAFSAFTSGNVSALPEDLISELLSYAGTYNDSRAEVQFIDDDVIGMFVTDPMVLIEIEARMVEKNFGFLADGRLQKVLERLGKVMAPKEGL